MVEPELPTIVGWRAWYTEGRTYRSIETDWKTLPPDGMLAVLLCESTRAPNGRHTRQILHGYDWYFKAGEVYGGNNESLPENTARYPGALFKRGKWTTAAALVAVNAAIEREDFAWIEP